MNPILMAAAVVVVVIVVLVRRFRGEPVDAKDLVIAPLILLFLGIKDLIDFTHWTPANITFLATSIVTGLGFGLVRGASTILFEKDGTLHQRYTAKTMIVWALSLAMGLGLSFGARAIGAEEAVKPMTLSIGVSLLGEMIACGYRGIRSGIPFSRQRSSRPDADSRSLSQLLPPRDSHRR